MKVTHICTSLDGGAGLCAKRIIKASRKIGVDARAVVMSGIHNETTDVIKYQYPWSSFKFIKKTQAALSLLGLWPKDIREIKRIEKVIYQERAKNKTYYAFTPPFSIYKNIHNHPWVKNADLIHLHWIGNFVDYPSFFPQINKPIVWTLHDQNPGLGGFHHQPWKEKSSISFQSLDDKWMDVKRQAYGKIHTSMTIVAISKMMSEFVNNNRLLKSFPNVIIHNGVDINAFRKISKEAARDVLSIPQENTVFMFSAYRIDEVWKGLNELIAALSGINIPNVTLIVLGNFLKAPQASFDIRCEGFISNSHLLSIYYSASDYFVLPSYQEAFAQTPLEAMACGTPVISFPCSGAGELINEINGIVCDDFNIESLKKGILQAIQKTYHRDEIREHVSSHFSYDIIAKQYIDLYQSILS